MTKQDLLNENIISLLGLQAIPNENKAALLDKMTEVIQKRIMLRVLAEMDDASQVELGKYENDANKAMEVIAEKVPNFEAIMKEEIMKLKQEMVAAAESAQGGEKATV